MNSYRYYAVNLHEHLLYRRYKYAISPLLGILTIFSYAPFKLWPLSIFALVVLLFFWMTSAPNQAAWQGFLYGLGYFGFGASWVFISVYRFGGASLGLSVFLTLLFIVAMSLYYTLMPYLLRRFLERHHASTALLAFPALWVLAEWARGHCFTGFPWLMLGYSQTQGPLEAYAPLIGVYGLSLLVCLTVGAITLCFFKQSQRIYLLCLGILAFIWVLAMPLESINWTHALPQPLSVSLVQGNVPQAMKWKPELGPEIIARYEKLTQPYWKPGQLIIWPEAAVTLFPDEAMPYLWSQKVLAQTQKATLITGIPLYAPKNQLYYNAAVQIGGEGGYYLKRHLVPFGEFFPGKQTFSWIYNQLSIPLSDLSSGPLDQPLLKAGEVSIAPYICYEIAFPGEVARTLKGAEVIVVLTDDSWFGDSLAASQHLEMAQMRAKETGRFVLFSSNTGPSAIINPEGNIEGKTLRDKAVVLTAEVPLMQGSTPYLILGDHPLGVLLTLMLLGLILIRRDRSRLASYQEVDLNFRLLKKFQ